MFKTARRSLQPRWRWFFPVVLGVLGIALSFQTRLGDLLSRASYDWLHQLTGFDQKVLDDSPVIMVYLDRDSYRELGLSESLPWPRDLHAQLINRLSAAGARAVVMDIIFSGAGDLFSSDQSLASAIRNNGKVVIGEGLNSSTSSAADVERSRIFRLESPFPLFATNAAATGLASTAVDEDFVSRIHFAGLPSISRRSLAYATSDLLGLESSRAVDADERWMRYYGPPLAIPHVSYHRALIETDVPDAYFHDRIVVVGAQPLPGRFNERGDEWRSPFVDLNEPDRFTPGAEVHATQLMNLLRADWLRRPAPMVEGILWCLFGLGTGTLMISLRPVWGIPIVATGALVVGMMSLVVMAEANYWLVWLIPVMVLAPVSIVGGVTVHSLDWYVVRRRAMRRIREQAELIDKAQDAILLFDLDGRLKSANPRANELFEIRSLEEQPIDFLSDSTETARQAVLESGQWQGEMKHHRKSGGETNLASRWTLIRDDRGEPTGILVIDTDVTEQKELEAQLIRAQRMEVIGNVAGSMAHDLNNSLAPVLMGVQMLKRSHTDDTTQQTLAHIESSARRSAEMVRQVLFVARGKDGDVGQINAGFLINEMVRLARGTFPKNIIVESQVASDLWETKGNSTQLNQVLLNLCINARDAMPDGGTLTLAGDNVIISEKDVIDMAHARPGNFVSIMVNDTGMGIPSEILPRMFDAFFTTKPEGKGTGLGLPTVKRIVEEHSGFIEIHSIPNEGASFEIFLPRSDKPSQTPTTAAQPGEVVVGERREILIVESSVAVRELLRDRLITLGFRVVTAEHAAEGLEIVASGRRSPDAIVLGMNLGGIAAVDFLTAVRKHSTDLPAVLICERSLVSLIERPKQTTVLETPGDLDQLVKQLSQLLGKNDEGK